MGAHIRIVPRHRRAAIEGEIEMHLQRVTLLIARLDQTDGDCDLEEDDHSGDPLDRGEAPTDSGTELLSTRPLYGVDQSRGPINVDDAHRARARELYS